MAPPEFTNVDDTLEEAETQPGGTGDEVPAYATLPMEAIQPLRRLYAEAQRVLDGRSGEFGREG